MLTDEPFSYVDINVSNNSIKMLQMLSWARGLTTNRGESAAALTTNVKWIPCESRTREKHEESSDAYVDRSLTFMRINAPKLSRYLGN